MNKKPTGQYVSLIEFYMAITAFKDRRSNFSGKNKLAQMRFSSSPGNGSEELDRESLVIFMMGPDVAINVGRARGTRLAIGALVAVIPAAEVAQVPGDGGLLAESLVAPQTLVSLLGPVMGHVWQFVVT